ncbi:hypothetical protein [Myceligenerans indicum]|uniref:Uncharacterized protein n=1 Tax=Myceligenerans indicum TaxID=2593663 RepID=A0ABS1LQX4_9MICO|nr:hypothetical protein [Myceligenerans indicum]MBL0888433.1 hypothetical protein [Myceligenerans indicum]
MGEETAAGEKHEGSSALPRPQETDPGPARPRRRGARRVVRPGNEREAVLGVSSDEREPGWGEAKGEQSAAGGHESNDERLLRDVPPHW